MRNTEQLLGSLGLFAYRCGSLAECNEAISQYGPEVSRGHDKITVQLRKGQQTAVDKNNITVASFSGKFKVKFKHQIQWQLINYIIKQPSMGKWQVVA